jgi:hypothetical protein
MRVLITGAAGFLGSHLTDAMLAEGHSVIGVDNLSTGNIANLGHLAHEPHFSFEEQNICQPFDMGSVDYVFNFASPASPADYHRLGLLLSRRIVGWSMREDMRSDLVIDALRMAWFERSPDKARLLFHSDRGSQYASCEFTQVLRECGITQSMSRKANCLDNACAETLFGSLKVERLHGQSFQTIREAKDEVIAWLLWYNRTRMHSTLGYVSPAQFEQRRNQVALERAA